MYAMVLMHIAALSLYLPHSLSLSISSKCVNVAKDNFIMIAIIIGVFGTWKCYFHENKNQMLFSIFENCLASNFNFPNLIIFFLSFYFVTFCFDYKLENFIDEISFYSANSIEKENDGSRNILGICKLAKTKTICHSLQV